ncbi:hypothetical protein [Saccharothrix deserti]|uniref:hypothetical protein n=1 Tax=Saccharothrix deserti TaxID=2593674 RepID=UPI00131A7F4F|nr:hypothetical protein [Saccharothrix deserti]
MDHDHGTAGVGHVGGGVGVVEPARSGVGHQDDELRRVRPPHAVEADVLRAAGDEVERIDEHAVDSGVDLWAESSNAG